MHSWSRVRHERSRRWIQGVLRLLQRPSNVVNDKDIYAGVDNSIMRTSAKLLKIFQDAGPKVIISEMQKRMLRGLCFIEA
ncbi:hypothetical protein K431DRAFT_162107 [Polychaeton citri CBS 116435]|uniref:Uncharacterized protein n=1 Tax=Polychaeton citri CBS 116435 TaxID=1314669 RepID=A0A9P4Q2G0_9PEZI|nr:hypothetical protein K431DRAFT_162107 [Polychaeton citri CBS 116435]